MKRRIRQAAWLMTLVLCVSAILPTYAAADTAWQTGAGPRGAELTLVRAEKRKRPSTGVMRKPSGKYGPLKIKTKSGSDYYVKVYTSDWKTKVLTAYIRGGDTLSTSLPKGKYKIKFGAGDDWYGESKSFGSGGTYKRMDDTLNYSSEGSGYSITLYVVKSGNASTKGISYSDF